MKRNADAICETCPYWFIMDGHHWGWDEERELNLGGCRVSAPLVPFRVVGFGGNPMVPRRQHCDDHLHPIVVHTYTCGLHPDFENTEPLQRRLDGASFNNGPVESNEA